MIRLMVIIHLLLPFSALAEEDDVAAVRKAATEVSKALAARDWGTVYDGWCERLQRANAWEAFFEVNFAIETRQQWSKAAQQLLDELFNEDAAEKALAAVLKKNPKLDDDTEMKILLDHVTDRRKLWVEWTKLMTADAEVVPTQGFAGARVEKTGAFALLTKGEITMLFKREGGAWKISTEEIETEYRKAKARSQPQR